LLSTFFAWLVDDRKVCRKNPFPEVKRIKVEEIARTGILPFAVYSKIIAEAPTDDLKFIYFCGFECGLRKNEIIQATPSWFDLQAKTCHPQDHATFKRKNGKMLPIPLTDEFVAFLRKYIVRGAPYCLRPDIEQGEWRYRYDFRKPFDEDIARHGVACSCHDMRRSFGSSMAQAGVPLVHIARWMGDTLHTVEKHYTHLTTDRSVFEKALAQLRGSSDTRPL
jgi:integrase